MKIDVAVHNQEILSLCDSELIGKTLSDGEIEITLNERFYKGENLEEEETIELLKSADNINIVGERSVALALKAKVIKEDGIKNIQGVPIAQVYSVE